VENKPFEAAMSIHEFVRELRAMGAVIERHDATPNNTIIKYNEKRIVIRGHGKQCRIGEAIWSHLNTLGVSVK
jgi:D-arabinose 5-phosphate isomerase GutQ